MSNIDTTARSAMKLALEVMQNQGDVSVDEWIAAEKSLREALNASLAEQPAPVAKPHEQEPVAKKTRIGLVTSSGWDSLPVGTEFYTSPPAQRTWAGLTDEDITQCSRDVVAGGKENSVDRFAYAIEAKLKEKNT